MPSKRRGVGKLLLLAIFSLALVGLTIGQAPPPPPNSSDPGPSRPPPPPEAGHLLRLQETIVKNQEQILDIQSDEIDRLQDEEIKEGDEAGMDARRRLRRLSGMNGRLRRQLRRLRERPFPIPPEIRQEMRELVELARDQGLQIRDGFNELKNLLPEEAAQELPEDDGTGSSSGDPADSGAGNEGMPETEAEASEVIGSAGVETPSHLIEIFERVHSSKTPRSNLSRYNQYKSRK